LAAEAFGEGGDPQILHFSFSILHSRYSLFVVPYSLPDCVTQAGILVSGLFLHSLIFGSLIY
jgi:hypothetical protein